MPPSGRSLPTSRRRRPRPGVRRPSSVRGFRRATGETLHDRRRRSVDRLPRPRESLGGRLPSMVPRCILVRRRTAAADGDRAEAERVGRRRSTAQRRSQSGRLPHPRTRASAMSPDGFAMRSAQAGVPHSAIASQRTASPDHEADDISNRVEFTNSVCVVTADQFPFLSGDFPELFAATKRMIGYWFWELEYVPLHMRQAIALVDEIWAGSRFVTDAFAAVAPVPVRHVPIPVAEPQPSDRDRAGFAALADVGERTAVPHRLRSSQRHRTQEPARRDRGLPSCVRTRRGPGAGHQDDERTPTPPEPSACPRRRRRARRHPRVGRDIGSSGSDGAGRMRRLHAVAAPQRRSWACISPRRCGCERRPSRRGTRATSTS